MLLITLSHTRLNRSTKERQLAHRPHRRPARGPRGPGRRRPLDGRLDLETLSDVPHPAALELNDIGRLHVDLAAPVMAEPYARNRDTGAFILVDEVTNATVGAGMVLEAS